MFEMIPNDFDVELVSEDPSESLFAARRTDVWHFVLVSTKKSESNYQSIDIGQFHWPRYSVARALAAKDVNVPSLVRKLGIHVDRDCVSIILRDKSDPSDPI